ncbi:MAG: DUF177 domain-containing protein [Lentisphaeria bacterium]
MTNLNLLTFDPELLPEDGITIQGELSLQELEIPETDRISCPHPFGFSLHAGPVHGGVLVQGTGHTALRCRCDRCLQYFDLPLALGNICYFFKNSDTDLVNLTDDVREDILLSFPQTVHCREGCLGLCPICGQNLNVRDCGCCPAQEHGSAWDALDKLELPDEDN